MSRRVVLSLALLFSVAAAAAALAALQPSGHGATGAYLVDVEGPEGPLFSGRVVVENATALRALEATGLALEVEEYPGMGAYVLSVGGHRAEGARGWVFEVQRDGAWRSGDRSAARYALEPGDALRWSWTRG